MTLRLNLCQFSGNAGKDAELKYMATGTPQAQFSIGVNNSYKKGDEWIDQTEWVNVVAWGDLAERMAPLITKGKGVYIAGKMQTRSWDDDKGQKHYRTEIIANTVQLLDKAPAQDGAPQARRQAPVASSRKPAPNPEDDLPWS